MSDREETASPRLTVSRCLRARYNESRCGRCLDECAHGSIHLDGVVWIDGERCRGCMACTAGCPSGALEVAPGFQRIVEGCPSTDALILGCTRHPLDRGIRIPCLGMLSEEHLVYLFASRPEPISLITAPCVECENVSAVDRMKERLLRLHRFTSLPFVDRFRFMDVRPETAERLYDRRSFFTAVRNKVVLQVAETVALGPEADPERSSTGVDYISKRIPQRSRLLGAALARFTPDQARIIGDVFRFRMELLESCDGCFGCVAVCPTGALESSPQVPRLNEAVCTGCELCSEFCAIGAIRILPYGVTATRHRALPHDGGSAVKENQR